MAGALPLERGHVDSYVRAREQCVCQCSKKRDEHRLQFLSSWQVVASLADRDGLERGEVVSLTHRHCKRLLALSVAQTTVVETVPAGPQLAEGVLECFEQFLDHVRFAGDLDIVDVATDEQDDSLARALPDMECLDLWVAGKGPYRPKAEVILLSLRLNKTGAPRRPAPGLSQ